MPTPMITKATSSQDWIEPSASKVDWFHFILPILPAHYKFSRIQVNKR